MIACSTFIQIVMKASDRFRYRWVEKQGPYGQRCVLMMMKWLYDDEITWDIIICDQNHRFSRFRRKRDRPTDRRTDGRTDRRMDGRTDRPSYRDARTHLKRGKTDRADVKDWYAVYSWFRIILFLFMSQAHLHILLENILFLKSCKFWIH